MAVLSGTDYRLNYIEGKEKKTTKERHSLYSEILTPPKNYQNRTRGIVEIKEKDVLREIYFYFF